MKPIKQITDWEIQQWGHTDDPYVPPELLGYALRGLSPQHPGIKNGSAKVNTSRIEGFENGMVQTRNSQYDLVGPPNPEFAEEYKKQYGYFPTVEGLFRQFIKKDENNG